MPKHWPAVLFFSIWLPVQPAFAYDIELSDIAVREAYFLGQRNDDKTREFLASYTKNLPIPKNGPYISEIRLLTPLAQVVQVSSERTFGYSAQQAQLDYQNRGDSLLLEVHIEFTITYGTIITQDPEGHDSDRQNSSDNASGTKGFPVRSQDFWRDFQYALKQNEDAIEPSSTHGEPIFAPSDGSSGYNGFVGAWVYLEYDASSVPSAVTEVHITPPTGPGVTTTFDLSKLH